MLSGSFYDVVLNHQIIINKLPAIGIVSDDTTNLCRSKENVLGLFGLEEIVNGCRIFQIKFPGGFPDYILIASCFKILAYGRTYQSPMPGNVYFRILFQSVVNY